MSQNPPSVVLGSMKIPALFISFLVTISANSYAEEAKLSLREAIKVAEGHHPDLNLQKARVDEANAQKQSAPSLPPPSLFFSAMGSNGPLNSDGRMENSFGLSQTIPFPTKLTAESKAKGYEVDAADAKLQAETLRIRAEVKATFFDLCGARKKIAFLEEKKVIYQEHSQRARSATLSDRIMQAHLVWVQTELELVNNELIVAREEERISNGKLNVALGSDPSIPIPELEDPPLSELPKSSDLQSSNPELRALTFSRDSAQASLTQAKSLWLPDLSITYRNARRFDGLMPNYSEGTIGITLPFLFFWETSGQTAAANARVQEAEAKVEKTRNDLKMQLLEARAHAESLREQALNFENRIIPQAEKRMKIAHGLVPSDMESLNEHRDSMESVIKLKLAALNVRIDFEKTVAKLESLLAGNELGQ
jgi:cobalt-zinc-cadmium efflux system outer membrane protein